jgi:methionyl-tRNA formyltransferase
MVTDAAGADASAQGAAASRKALAHDHPESAPLRIVYCGTPEFAVPTLEKLLASRHIVCGVITQPDRPRGRGQKLQPGPVKLSALPHHVPVFQPERLRTPDVRETLQRWAPDLGVVAAYGKLIPDDLLAVPRLGMINVHASLLPKYRGAAPIQRAVIDGETETGVTIMRVIKALDAGGMLAKVHYPIGPDETSDVVERKLSEMGASLLLDAVEGLSHGPVAEEQQDDTRATYAARLTKAEGLIDWTLPATGIHNRVRGLYPWPHAYTFLGSERLIVLATHVDATSGSDAAPGTIVSASPDGIGVVTGHGGQIVILQVQPEGRRAMSARDFLGGHPLSAGALFGNGLT